MRAELVDEIEVAGVEPLLVEPADELFIGRGAVDYRPIIDRWVVTTPAPFGADPA